VRKAGFVVSRGEVDPGRIGISTAMFDEDRRAIGSLSYVIDEDQNGERLVRRLTALLVATARNVELAMGRSD
jgi:DNA-binding IclR family transcriptional regulator